MAKETKVIELAWAGGFFDGEGNIRFSGEKKPVGHRARTYGSVRLSIAQVDRYVLDRFMSAVGNLGAVRGAYKQKNPNSKPYYQYNSSGQDAIDSFNKIKQYLSPIKLKQGENSILLDKEQKLRPKLGNGMVQRVKLKKNAKK